MSRAALIIVGLLIIALLVPVVCAAIEPATYNGTVTVGGRPAPAGTVVQVFVNGEYRASTTVLIISAGGDIQAIYEVAVPDGPEGGAVTFYVGSLLADQQTVFAGGTVTPLDLTAAWRLYLPVVMEG